MKAVRSIHNRPEDDRGIDERCDRGRTAQTEFGRGNQLQQKKLTDRTIIVAVGKFPWNRFPGRTLTMRRRCRPVMMAARRCDRNLRTRRRRVAMRVGMMIMEERSADCRRQPSGHYKGDRESAAMLEHAFQSVCMRELRSGPGPGRAASSKNDTSPFNNCLIDHPANRILLKNAKELQLEAILTPAVGVHQNSR